MVETVLIRLPPDFPVEDVEAIGQRLIVSKALVAGYMPPNAGMLSIAALYYAKTLKNIETTILPDRNLISRMAKIAKEGVHRPLDPPTAIAADLMAFAQALDFDIEPSIAFHELAYRDGNDNAHKELSWFRAADDGQAKAWIDLAQGRLVRLPLSTPAPLADENLAHPLKRWRRNYVVALKIGELELSSMPHLDRALALFQWMIDDFFLAGPAAIFATMYFAPNAERRRLIKQLRSPDRNRAIAGIKNAAWDITYLSDFVAKLARSDSEHRYFILAR